MRPWWFLPAASALFGCVCFNPVPEIDPTVDASKAGGGGDASLTVDSGSDGGAGDAGPQCRVASDCPWLPSDAGLYYPCPNSGGMSCIDGRCIFECDSGRACETDAGSHCLLCRSPVEKTDCGATVCSAIWTCRMQVFSSTCAQGPVEGASFDVIRQPDCSWKVAVPDGGPVVGGYWDLDVGQSFGTFPGVEGTCVGRDLFTGVPRMQWSCPGGCNFIEMGCE
ncbi:MAG: hypothetical protein HYZ28_26925 [Myxococcales bacterium]|nr:hypothetical protein [Myxococcales bacterium]